MVIRTMIAKIVFLIYSLSFLSGINFSISLYIFDENSNPLEGANIIVSNNDNFLVGGASDSDGSFILTNLDENLYQVKISYIGHVDFITNLEFDGISDIKKNIFLLRKSISMSELEIISQGEIREFVGAASSIDEDAINLIKPIGTQEILEYVPGINGFSDDGTGNSRLNIGIRGINPRRSSRVLVLEDGIPIQPAIYVYPNMYYNPPTERINEVEIIKSSASILYGPQTMGGVINYLTKRPGVNSRPKVKLMLGTYALSEINNIAGEINKSYLSTYFETGNLSNFRFKPNLEVLIKKGNGFRDNNDFMQANATLKFNYSNENNNYYFKTNLNYEDLNATYTGLTKYSYDNNYAFNPKENDIFDLFRFSTDLIHTKIINENVDSKTSVFLSYFSRDWWRENDVFIKVSDIGEDEYGTLGASQALDKVRYGDNQFNSGRLRKFYISGLERKFSIRNKFIDLSNELEVGGRVYFERFIDDTKKGYAPNDYDGLYFVPEESYVDANGNESYDEGETFTDCNINHTICEDDPDWDASMGDGVWTKIDGDNHPYGTGQSHHYESFAFAGYLSHKVEIDSKEKQKFIIKPGIRFEIFEQERVDRLRGSTYLDKTTYVILPGIGINKQFNNLNLFGGIHRGFTPPSSGTLKILNFGESSSGGLDLKPEKSWNKELGFRFSNENISYELAVFHISIEDLVAASRAFQFINLGKVKSMGLEFSGTIYPSLLSSDFKNIFPTLFLSLSLLDTEVLDGITYNNNFYHVNEDDSNYTIDISGNELPYSPKMTFNLGLQKNLFDVLDVRFDYRYVSSSYTDFQNIEFGNLDYIVQELIGISGPIPDLEIINISSAYSLSDKMKISLSVKNLLDEKYIGSRLHSNPSQPEANKSSGIIPGAPRQVNIGIDYNF